MLIRPAGTGDLAAVGEVTVASFAPFTRGPGDPYVERLRDAGARLAEAELWVAVEAEQVLGTVTTCPPGSPWRELAREGEGEFRMLAVSPAAQGRGVGDALVRHVLDHYRVAGAGSVVLSSLESQTAAHRLYARHGFVRLPERDWDPLPDVHLIAFRRPL